MARMHQHWWFWASKLRYWCLPPRAACLLFLLPLFRLSAQDTPHAQTWNLYYQATSIGQYHGPFRAAYSGPLSLANHREAEASLTATLYFGLKWNQTQFYFDPELAGGRGFSTVNGIANFSNGELPRVASATPKPYIARLYITQDFGFG